MLGLEINNRRKIKLSRKLTLQMQFILYSLFCDESKHSSAQNPSQLTIKKTKNEINREIGGVFVEIMHGCNKNS